MPIPDFALTWNCCSIGTPIAMDVVHVEKIDISTNLKARDMPQVFLYFGDENVALRPSPETLSMRRFEAAKCLSAQHFLGDSIACYAMGKVVFCQIKIAVFVMSLYKKQ